MRTNKRLKQTIHKGLWINHMNILHESLKGRGLLGTVVKGNYYPVNLIVESFYKSKINWMLLFDTKYYSMFLLPLFTEEKPQRDFFGWASKKSGINMRLVIFSKYNIGSN